MSKSFIYVLSNGSVSKIGITTCPYQRLANIRFVSGENYEPVRLWECNETSAYEFEKDVINALSPHCVKGREWFGVPSWTAVSTITRLATNRTGLRPVEWPTERAANQVTVYLSEDLLTEIDALRASRRPVPSRNAMINELIWDGLPTDSQLKIRRERRGAEPGGSSR